MPHQLPRHIPATFDTEKMVSLKDLSHLQRREFKIHGGQIGDQSSDITYSSICKQIDEGVREGFTGTEVIRAVLRIVKPGAFKDMLTHKDDITISELKRFLRPHLGEKASTELFQELMCAKQSEQEPPQQFLYHMIGLKQKILFQSKQANTDIHYDPKTIQEVFLHTIYQGLGSKHTDIRQQLRPLLSNNQVTDKDIVSQVMKILSDENEHQRRLGYGLRQKTTHSHSVRVDDIEQTAHKKEHQTIQQLSAQVETLTNMVAALMDQQTTAMHITHPKSVPVQVLGQAHSPLTSIPRRMPPSTPGQPSLTRKGKIPICTNCLNQGLENCNHCFVCGDPGHQAVGCLKRASDEGQPEAVPEFQSHPITPTRKQRYSKRQRCDKRAGDTFPQETPETPDMTIRTAPLIGRKSLLKCFISGYAATVLFDSGSQVSIIDRLWRETFIPNYPPRPLEELLDQGESLNVYAANGQSIPYDGWVELTVNLMGNDNPNLAIQVPFLVSQLSLPQPLLGANVL